MIGKTIRDLKIIKEIGKGGMGVVYLAETSLGRRRAIKCLAPELTGNPQFRERFNQEARNQASLDHPNILQVTDLVEYDGQFLMIMDYVDGQGLDEIIREHGKIPEPRTLFIFKEMLKGLHFAHSQGLIHRDIKPSNILIDKYDRVRITDFGIAIMMGNERFTSTGFHIGTAQYMSPEQISRPKEVDFRTDVYSSGIVLYEMLTGEVPFDGDTTFEVMEKQVRSPAPNPMSKNAQISKPVAKMVLKALQKEPEQRFSDCRAFLEGIEAYQAAPVMGEKPVKQRVTVIEPVRPKTVVEAVPVIELDEPVKSKKPKIEDKPPKQGINWKMIAVFVLVIVGVGFFGYSWFKAQKKVIAKDGSFIAYDDGTVLDTRTNLMWAAKDNGEDIDWEGAKRHCENYLGGGYRDWRMPTQDELAGLYDESKEYEPDCNSRIKIHTTKLIRITCWVVWASDRSSKGDSGDAAVFGFYDGERGWRRPSDSGNTRALPVRASK